jgi:hypothetical protein
MNVLGKDYKGDECSVCNKPITIKNKSGLCRIHGGSRMSAEARKRLSINRTRQSNPNWKGDLVGKSGVHAYIKRHYKRPDLCDECKENYPIDLANISQAYKRDISDWEWLCRRCHMTKDGRLERLNAYR